MCRFVWARLERGIHAQVRSLLFGEQLTYDTGWGMWVWWARMSECDSFEDGSTSIVWAGKAGHGHGHGHGVARMRWFGGPL